MVSIRIKQSALKHGISEMEIRQVLADRKLTKFFPIHEDANGNPQEMLVGYTQCGVLLEIGVTYTDQLDFVFHARRVSSEYKKLYGARLQ